MSKRKWRCRECGYTANTGRYCVVCGVTEDQKWIETASAKVELERARKEAQARTETASLKGSSLSYVGALVLLLFVAALGAFVYASTDSGQTKVAVVKQAVDTTLGVNDSTIPADYKAKTELSLNDLDLDLSVDDMHKLWGKEKRVEPKGEGAGTYYYENAVVGIQDNTVMTIISDTDKALTKTGLHEGSSFAQVKKIYGTDYMVMKSNNLRLVEYPFKSLKGREGLLRFAIDQNDKVYYISARITKY